jgi:hypothetical protein
MVRLQCWRKVHHFGWVRWTEASSWQISTRHCKALDYDKMQRLCVFIPRTMVPGDQNVFRWKSAAIGSAIRTDLQMLHVLNANISRQQRTQVLARILRKNPLVLLLNPWLMSIVDLAMPVCGNDQRLPEQSICRKSGKYLSIEDLNQQYDFASRNVVLCLNHLPTA